MARIAGIDLPRDKRVEIGLTYIYGIGRSKSNEILAATGINPDTRIRDLTEAEVNKLREYIDRNVQVEGDARREVSLNIKRLIEIDVIVGLDIEEVCLSVDRAQNKMQEPVRDLRETVGVRRKK